MTIISYLKKSVPKLKISGCMVQRHPHKIFYVLNDLSLSGTYRHLIGKNYIVTVTDFAQTFWELYIKHEKIYQHFRKYIYDKFKKYNISITKWNAIEARVRVDTKDWSPNLRDTIKTLYEQISAVKKHPGKYLAKPNQLTEQWHHLQNIRRFIMHNQMSAYHLDTRLQFEWWYLHHMDKEDTKLYLKYGRHLHEI